jgi:hypothetical protein
MVFHPGTFDAHRTALICTYPPTRDRSCTSGDTPSGYLSPSNRTDWDIILLGEDGVVVPIKGRP